MNDATYRQLRDLHTQALELCYAIEALPASTRQTEISLKAGSVATELQKWWQEIDDLRPIGKVCPACGTKWTGYDSPDKCPQCEGSIKADEIQSA